VADLPADTLRSVAEIDSGPHRGRLGLHTRVYRAGTRWEDHLPVPE
jgi:hypothetical protein